MLAGALSHIVGDIRETLTADLPGSSTLRGRSTGPTTDVERMLAEVLAEILHLDRVPVDGHFFEDLGADSLVMAHFCARVRKRPDLPSVSMKDAYRHPTIRDLATALGGATPTPVGPPVVGWTPEAAAAPVGAASPGAAAAPVPAAPGAAPASTLEYVLCGALQLLTFLGYSCLAALALAAGYDWISAGSGLLAIYLRSVAFGGASFLAMCTLPILAKWVLIGRWKPQQIRIWSLGYVRFWVVKTLVQSNLLVLLFIGTPLYVLYLRALGARIGRGVAILTKHVPVCTDLITIGAGTVIRKEAFLTGYRGDAGLIQMGRVTLGRDVFVGERAVLDIDTSMGDGSQLGHASSLHAGQAVPDGERWHGSPAQPTHVDYRGVAPARCGSLRRTVYSANQLLMLLALYLPLTIGGVGILLAGVPRLGALLDPGPVDFTRWTLYRDYVAVSFVLFFGAVLVGLLGVMTVPRVLSPAIKPGKVYPLYGIHYSIHRTIVRITNIKFFPYLFGDSSYIVHYLLCLGYRLSRVEQTGSNFGTGVAHDSPYLTSVGRGTMVADGLSVINADVSSTSFRVSRVSIGAHNFLGNGIAYPSHGRTGDNCLLATKVLVPIDGPIREGIGLLGSPSFEIPRTVLRDRRFDHLRGGDELRRRLAAKNRYNLRTMAVALLVRWIHVAGLTLLTTVMAAFYPRLGWESMAGEVVLVPLYTMGYFMLIERAATRFRSLRPQYCSIYDPYFWWHERYWKLVVQGTLDRMLNGTPFKNLASRLLGVRLGRRVFDDGCTITERTLATVGDDCALNVGSTIQCHSQEDGAFKSDRTMIGARCTLGVGAFVHYGVTMGEGAVLAADSFLMKGEEVPPHARWGGNPAGETANVRDHPAAGQAGGRTRPVRTPPDRLAPRRLGGADGGQQDELGRRPELAGRAG